MAKTITGGWGSRAVGGVGLSGRATAGGEQRLSVVWESSGSMTKQSSLGEPPDACPTETRSGQDDLLRHLRDGRSNQVTARRRTPVTEANSRIQDPLGHLRHGEARQTYRTDFVGDEVKVVRESVVDVEPRCCELERQETPVPASRSARGAVVPHLGQPRGNPQDGRNPGHKRILDFQVMR